MAISSSSISSAASSPFEDPESDEDSSSMANRLSIRPCSSSRSNLKNQQEFQATIFKQPKSANDIKISTFEEVYISFFFSSILFAFQVDFFHIGSNVKAVLEADAIK